MSQNHPQPPNSRPLPRSTFLPLHLRPRSLKNRLQKPPHLIMIPLLNTNPIPRPRKTTQHFIAQLHTPTLTPIPILIPKSLTKKRIDIRN